VSYPKSALKEEYEDAAQIGLRNACKDAEERYDLPPGTMLAVASRETNMRNIVGDGGHGRGVFQIDDRWHASWLAQHANRNGVPPVREAAFYAASLIAANIASARKAGVPKDEALRVALAGYNAGMGNALADYKHGGNPDAHTTGGNYASDVLGRRRDVETFLPDSKKQDDDKPKANGSHPTPAKGTVPAEKGEKIVINPHHLRSMANLLDRSDDDFRDYATRLNALKKPLLEHRVDVQLTSELSAINARLRMLATPARTWADDLRRRAARVDEPAGTGRAKGKHTPVKYREKLAIGSQGAQVRTLQRLLNKFGYGPLEVDGEFGPLTQAALRRYQAAKHLPVNGVAGDKTWEALLGHSITIRAPRPNAAPGGPVPEGFLGDLVKTIRGQVGTTAGFGYNQSNKYTAWAGRGGAAHAEAWCADFVSWAYAHSGHPVGPGGKGFAAVSEWRSYFQGKGDWHTTPKVGAVVCFDWNDGGQSTDHVGIVSRIEGGKVYYISGNTHDPGGSGHVGVYEKSVPLGNVLGYGY